MPQFIKYQGRIYQKVTAAAPVPKLRLSQDFVKLGFVNLDGESVALTEFEKMQSVDVRGDLDLMGAPIHKLPPSVRVGGTLELGYTKISELPANIHVAKDLNVWETPLRKLPEHLQVGGSLNLSYSKITKLPAGLHVGGDLFIWATAVTELPADLQVGGKIYCEKGQLTRLPEKYNSKLHFG